MSRGIQHPDRVLRAVAVHHQLTQGLLDSLVVPREIRKELLQGPHRHPGRQGDRFDALALQVRDEPDDVSLPVAQRGTPLETRPKYRQQRTQSRLQRSNLIRSHDEFS